MASERPGQLPRQVCGLGHHRWRHGPCTITVAFKTTAGSVSTPLLQQDVIFTGTDNGGTFSWICDKSGASDIADKYKPQVCNGN